MKIGDRQKLEVIKARAEQGRMTYELDKKYVEKLAGYVNYEEPQTSYQNTSSQNTSNSCSECGASILDNNKFCTECGALQKSQPSAGATGGGFCGKCGTALATKNSPCPKCGHVKTTLNPQSPPQQPQDKPKPQYKQQPQPAYNNFQGNRRLTPHVHSGGKPSAAWWLLPIFLGWFGGLIAWLSVKDRDPRMAKKCLIIGIILTLAPVVLIFALIPFSYINQNIPSF